MIQRGRPDEEGTDLEQLADSLAVELALEQYGKGVFQLCGEDGNAHYIMARVNKALRRKGWPERALRALRNRMTEGDYDNLLRVAMGVQDSRAYELECLAVELEERRQELLAEDDDWIMEEEE